MHLSETTPKDLQSQFLAGRRLIYLAYRLYEPFGRIDTAQIETCILKGVQSAFSDLGKQLSFWPVFFPFRDTFQGSEEAQGALSWEAISDGCTQRLNSTFALIAHLKGPSYDDGIGVEIGEALGMGLPTVLFINDINRYHSAENPEISYVVGPVVDTYMGRIIANGELFVTLFSPELLDGLDVEHEVPKVVRSLNFTETLAERFTAANKRTLDSPMRDLEAVVAEVCLSPEAFIGFRPEAPRAQRNSRTVFIDFDGQRGEWQRILADDLERQLRSEGWEVRRGLRYDRDHQRRLLKDSEPPEVVKALAHVDMENMLSSDVLVLNANGPEMPFESAIFQGIAKVLRKRVILYYSDNQLASDPPALPPLFRNPIPAFAQHGVATRLSEIPTLIRAES